MTGNFKAKMSIFVQGLPKPQPRPRFGRGHAYTPDSVKDWKDAITLAVNKEWAGKHPILGPAILAIDFYFPPKGIEKSGEWHTKKPDLDNCVKAVMDALTGCGVWRDDCQVASLTVSKVFAKVGEIGASVSVGEWEA